MKQVDIVDFPYRSDAEKLFGAVRDMPDAIWLDSGKPRSLYGRFDIISAQPDTVLETIGKITRIITSNATTSSEEDPFSLAEDLLVSTGSVDESYNSHPFIGGLAGSDITVEHFSQVIEDTAQLLKGHSYDEPIWINRND